jgi:site-specific recombinase XerD
LHTFFGYLVSQDTEHADQYQKVVSIPIKQSSHPMMEYLEREEVKTIMDSIDRNDVIGRRDYALLNFLYNTGARVQEACDLCIEHVHIDPPPLVVITGKRRKTRQVPLWPETATLLKSHIAERQPSRGSLNNIFLNSKGYPLTRYGIRHIIQKRIDAAEKQRPSLAKKKVGPHTFRHYSAYRTMPSELGG